MCNISPCFYLHTIFKLLRKSTLSESSSNKLSPGRFSHCGLVNDKEYYQLGSIALVELEDLLSLISKILTLKVLTTKIYLLYYDICKKFKISN